MGNNFLFLKVIYANMVYNLARRKKVDYDTVANIVGFDSRIGHSHLAVNHQSGPKGKSGRGAGGHCFMKDMSAFVEMFKEEPIKSSEDKIVLELLNSIVKLNNHLLISTGKDIELLKGVYKIK